MNLTSNKWRIDFFYAIPSGWWVSFGEDLCNDLKAILDKLPPGARDDFQIIDIKEKFGKLHIYTNWETKEIRSWISKYEDLSARTCIKCGAPATHISTSYILPWCEKHKSENDIPINEYLINSIKEVQF